MTKTLSFALHIGAHKTASTYLQQALQTQQGMLTKEGVRFLGPQFLRREGNSINRMFGLGQGAKPARTGPEQLRFLAKRCRRLVLSEENFAGALTQLGKLDLPLYPAAADNIEALAQAIAPQKFDLFVAVRRHTGYVSSAYSQTLLGDQVLSPQTFCDLNDWRGVDWFHYLQRLSAIPVVGKIYTWRYEDHMGVIRLVLRRMLRWKVGGKVDLPTRRSHRGLSQKALLSTLEWTEEGRAGNLAQIARKRYPVTNANPAFHLFDADQEAEAEVQYAAQLERIETLDKVEVLHPPKRVRQG